MDRRWRVMRPEDRHRDGILPSASIVENLDARSAASTRFRKGPLLDWSSKHARSRSAGSRSRHPLRHARLAVRWQHQRVILAQAFSHRPGFLMPRNQRGPRHPLHPVRLRRAREAVEKGSGVLLISRTSTSSPGLATGSSSSPGHRRRTPQRQLRLKPRLNLTSRWPRGTDATNGNLRRERPPSRPPDGPGRRSRHVPWPSLLVVAGIMIALLGCCLSRPTRRSSAHRSSRRSGSSRPSTSGSHSSYWRSRSGSACRGKYIGGEGRKLLVGATTSAAIGITLADLPLIAITARALCRSRRRIHLRLDRRVAHGPLRCERDPQRSC